jgi:hypothetical protein
MGNIPQKRQASDVPTLNNDVVTLTPNADVVEELGSLKLEDINSNDSQVRTV